MTILVIEYGDEKDNEVILEMVEGIKQNLDAKYRVDMGSHAIEKVTIITKGDKK